MMWKRNVSCNIESYSQNHVDVFMLQSTVLHWRLTYYYGFPERNHRREVWDFIEQLSITSQLPWCIVGDFNDLLYASDKEGCSDHPQYLMNGFRATIDESNMVKLPLTGGRFTQEKSKGTSRWVPERLARAFFNNNWCQLFPFK